MVAINHDLSINLEVKTLVLILLFALPGLAFLKNVYYLLFSPLRKIPGPFLARFTRLWELYHVWIGDAHYRYIELHRKYGILLYVKGLSLTLMWRGPVVRMGPNRYSFVEPSDTAVIYGLGTKFTKSSYFSAFVPPNRRNLFTVESNEDHSMRRRRVADLCSMTTVVAYEPHVDEMTSLLMKKLFQFSEHNRPISVPTFLQYYTFDVIGMVTLNTPFGLLENESDVQDIVEDIHGMTRYSALMGLIPEYHVSVFKAMSFCKVQPKVTAMFDFVAKQIQLHQADGPVGRKNWKAESFLTKSLDLLKRGKMSMEDVFDVCAGNIAAGSDTTATTLSAALYQIYSNPDVLQTLRKELDDALADGCISSPITFQEAQGLQYLQAVIKETLRFNPGVGSALFRIVPKGGAILAEHWFPEGTEVGANPWAVHYCSHIYGEDSQSYRPDRWLHTQGSGDLQNKMMFAFGAGARTCIGKNISLLELSKVIPQIVLNFEIKLEEGLDFKSKVEWLTYLEYNAEIILRRKVDT